MNILYEGFVGTIGPSWFGWMLIIGAIGVIGIGIYLYIEGGITGVSCGSGILFSVLTILLGIFVLTDTRTPIVKATVDNTIPWKEVTNDYELLSVEGDIYTFKVLHTNNEEWEWYLNDLENK